MENYQKRENYVKIYRYSSSNLSGFILTPLGFIYSFSLQCPFNFKWPFYFNFPFILCISPFSFIFSLFSLPPFHNFPQLTLANIPPLPGEGGIFSNIPDNKRSNKNWSPPGNRSAPAGEVLESSAAWRCSPPQFPFPAEYAPVSADLEQQKVVNISLCRIQT